MPKATVLVQACMEDMRSGHMGIENRVITW